MISLTKPSADQVRDFIEKQSKLEFSYSAVAATKGGSGHRDYKLDRTSTLIGKGEDCFKLAKNALQSWRMFELEWTELYRLEADIRTGMNVALCVRIMGLYFLNAARVVYLIDEVGEIDRFGFAYGTLPGHVERGEERFLLTWNHSSDEVDYEMLAFSRPNVWWGWCAYPLLRYFQRRFAHQSVDLMRRIVSA